MSRSSSGTATRPRVEALARGDRPADLDQRLDLALAAAHLVHTQADGAVGEVDDIVRIDALGQAGPRHRHAGRVAALGRAAGEDEALARLELDAVVDQRTDAQLGPREVLEDGHRTADGSRRRAHARRVLGMHLAVAVREVQAGDVEPGLNHPFQGLRVTGGGADGGDDLGAAHVKVQSTGPLENDSLIACERSHPYCGVSGVTNRAADAGRFRA
jgi:hypothetical protein